MIRRPPRSTLFPYPPLSRSRFGKEAIPRTEFRGEGRPASDEALARLTAALTRAVAGTAAVPWTRRGHEDVASLARFQFGDAGDALVAGATTRGRWPFVRIFREGRQLGAVTDRGKVSLALAGGEVLAKARVNTVEIEDF